MLPEKKFITKPTNRNSRFEEPVLHHVERNTDVSTRRIARTENAAHVTVWRILREQQLCPYHFQRVQGLTETDQPRVDLYTWFLQMYEREESFVSTILFTDEASFTRDGIFNFHNNRNWVEENPHVTVHSSRHQHQFGCTGIIDKFLIGPFFLDGKLTGTNYVDFLSMNLHEMLEEVPVDIRLHMRFMHDGALPHFSRVARQFLNQHFANK